MGVIGKIYNFIIYIRASPNCINEFKELSGKLIPLGNYYIIIYYLTSDLDPCWAHADYSLYIYREKTLFKKTP